MAIVFEEQKNTGTLLTIVLWLTVMAIVGTGLYYLFFKSPTLVEVKAPESFGSIEKLSEINLDPKEVLESPTFKSLKPYITPSLPTQVGRTNPFLAF